MASIGGVIYETREEYEWFRKEQEAQSEERDAILDQEDLGQMAATVQEKQPKKCQLAEEIDEPDRTHQGIQEKPAKKMKKDKQVTIVTNPGEIIFEQENQDEDKWASKTWVSPDGTTMKVRPAQNHEAATTLAQLWNSFLEIAKVNKLSWSKESFGSPLSQDEFNESIS